MQLLPDASVVEEDVSGKTWMSDDDKYYLTFNKNGKCIISNYPRKLDYDKPYHDLEDRNDTTRISLYGKWEIYDNIVLVFYDIESDRRLKYDKYDSTGKRDMMIKIKYNFFGGDKKYIPYYTTMDEDEMLYWHTYSIVDDKNVSW